MNRFNRHWGKNPYVMTLGVTLMNTLTVKNEKSPQSFIMRATRLAAISGTTLMLAATHAMAEAVQPTGDGLGKQIQSMSQEGLTTGGTVASAVMYVLAFVCFIAGVWALWESRNQQTRTPGKIGMGIAGLVLCGLFATGPKWINKAANTASGGQATVGTSAQAYQFTGGN